MGLRVSSTDQSVFLFCCFTLQKKNLKEKCDEGKDGVIFLSFFYFTRELNPHSLNPHFPLSRLVFIKQL